MNKKKVILAVMHPTMLSHVTSRRKHQPSAWKLTSEYCVISCISYGLLYDWPSYLKEQINHTFQFRNCHGKFFCSFWCVHGNNPRAVSVCEKRLHTKCLCPWANAIYPWVKGLVQPQLLSQETQACRKSYQLNTLRQNRNEVTLNWYRN